MKKLVIAVGAIAFAIGLQAASVNWSIDGAQINGDWDLADGDSAPEGWGIYVFDENGATSQSAMLALLNTASFDADTWQTAMGNAVATSKIGADGTAVGTGATMTPAGGDLSAYVVLFDAETLADATYAFVSAVYTTADTDPVPTSFKLGEDGWINALNYDAAGSAGSNWYSVTSTPEPTPEPTSGLLLLLGLSGLALRRRRA